MSGLLVTFGITPAGPQTGYGYIKVGAPSSPGVFGVDAFREKPDGETANAYVESGDYLWNSGMFLIKASVFLRELGENNPTMLEGAKRSWQAAERSSGDIALDGDEFAAILGDSIDYAVMEKTVNAAVVPVDPKWNDIGSWASLWDIGDKDENGNVLIGDTIAIDAKQSYVRGSDRLIAVVGVEDLVIVDTPDALLVTTRERAQDVKLVVDKLKAESRPELESIRKDSQ
jgi:mannose-1-phosphate guanylyltransferase/mannose-6-phosphate isomerase